MLLTGPDATPVVTPLRQVGVENHRTLPHLPQSIPLQSAPQARLLVGWWGREIHIWKFRQTMQAVLNSDDVEQSKKKNRPRLGRIFIKGESNITSCSISRDGSILVVSTVMAIKAFHLTLPGDDPKQELKIRKIEIPSSIGSAGATLVQISPNGRWLGWVQEGSQVRIAKITREDSAVSIQPRPARLNRLRRDIPKHVRLGGLGNYERRVTHITFSPDSSVLATADLAGYVDTWILHDGGMQNGAAAAEDNAASSSDSSDSSDDGDASESGPAWIRNPKASLFPRLAHAPVALSFSDDALGPILRDEGEDGPDDYILLAVTAASRIYTFNPLEGSLTNWSRRNAAWKLPEEFRTTRDPIKGVVWSGSRIWMYGTSSLFMLDLSFDFTEQDSASSKNNRKRKRGADSGAGSKTEVGALAPKHLRMSLAADGKPGQWVDVEMADVEPQAEGSGDEDEIDDAEENMGGGELEKLRKREQRGRSEGEGDARKKWLHTYKYRPILGVVPLKSAADGEGTTNGVNGSGKPPGIPTIEVALIERPKWDAED